MERDPRIARIQKQVPEGVSLETILSALETCGDDEFEAICFLLDVAKQSPAPKDDVQQKWSEIREICDAHDDEIQRHMSKST